MKLKLINYGVLTAALALVGVASAHAQVDQVEKVNVPFDFYAEGQKLPAGTYNVGVDVENDMTTLTSATTGHTVMFLGTPANNLYSDNPKLVFNHSGDSYRLREVQSDELNVDVPVTK
jgi:hypothetical protein